MISSTYSIRCDDHTLPLRVFVDDFIQLLAVDSATLIYIDGVKALLVALFVPVLLRIRCLHQLLAEVTALIDIQISVAIVVGLREHMEDDGAQLFARDLGLFGYFSLARLIEPLAAISYAASSRLLTIHLHLLPLQASSLRGRERAGHRHRIAHGLLAGVARLLRLVGGPEGLTCWVGIVDCGG